ncbi:membrane protein [Klebsiella pneumoniae]|nr:membrane protein [Klebsiella pneumoniae]
MSDEAMLSVIPAGIFSRLRIFLGRLKPHALPVARRHIVLGSIGAGTGLAVTSMFSHWLLGEVNLWFIAPMGASAVLLFGVPSSPLAQPWSIVGGNVLSALIGVTVGMLVPDAALACGLAAALAIAGMYFLRCLHPPGGAVALTAILGGAGVHSEGYHFVLTPVLLNSLMLALLAIVFNNLVGRRYPHPLAAEEVKSRAVPLGISVTREDIHAALLEGQFLDIDEDDVQELLAAGYRSPVRYCATPRPKLQSPFWLLIIDTIRSSPLRPQCSASSSCKMAKKRCFCASLRGLV